MLSYEWYIFTLHLPPHNKQKFEEDVEAIIGQLVCAGKILKQSTLNFSQFSTDSNKSL